MAKTPGKKNPVGRPKKRKIDSSELAENSDSQAEGMDSQDEGHHEIEVVGGTGLTREGTGTDNGANGDRLLSQPVTGAGITGTETGQMIGAVGGIGGTNERTATGNVNTGAIRKTAASTGIWAGNDGTAAGIVGRAVERIVQEPAGFRTPMEPVAGNTRQQPGFIRNIISVIDQRNNIGMDRNLISSHGTNSTRQSRANSPNGALPHLHQEYLVRFETFEARQETVEKDISNINKLLGEISRKLTDNNSATNDEPLNRPNGNRDGDRTDTTERVNYENVGRKIAVPGRRGRFMGNNTVENPTPFQSEFARDFYRSNLENRNNTVEPDSFDKFYDQNRPISGPPMLLTTPVTRNETYRHELMREEEERDRNAILNPPRVLFPNENRTQPSNNHVILQPRPQPGNENMREGSRQGRQSQSGPRENIQNSNSVNSRAADDWETVDSNTASRVLRSCPEWSGPGSGVTFRAWMASMRNRMLFGHNLSEQWKKIIVYEKLTDTALMVAGEEMNPGIQSNERVRELGFEEYVRVLAEKLDPQLNLQRLKDQLEGRKQRADEPIDFYLLSITNQWKKIYTPNEQKRSESRETLCKLYKNSIINPILRKKAREFHMYLNPPNDYEQLAKAILTEARLVREMVAAGDLSADKEVGAKEHMDYELYQKPGKSNKIEHSKVNSIEEGVETDCEINFVQKDNWKGNLGNKKSFQKKRPFFKPRFQVARLKNQNIGMKGKCFWCGDANHFVRECPRKAKGLDRTVNGLELEQECITKGFEIDDEGLICAWIQNDDEDQEPVSLESDSQINAFARKFQNGKNNSSQKKGGYFRKRKAKFRKNNKFQTVTVVSHYDDNDVLLEEIIEGDEEAQENTEIQSLDLNEIFENNMSLGALNYDEEIDEEIFKELDNEINSIETLDSLDTFSSQCVINSLDDFKTLENEALDQSNSERTQISELDCDKLDKYF